MKKIILNFVKLLVTAFLIVLIIKEVNSKEIFSKIKDFSLAYFFLTLLYTFLMQLSHVVRWKILLNVRKEMEISFAELFKHHFIGLFFQLFLPSSASGDVVKAYRLSSGNKAKTHIYSSVFFGRILGLFIFLSFGLVFLIFFPGRFGVLPLTLKLLMAGIYFAIGGLLTMIFKKKVFSLFYNISVHAYWVKIREKIVKFQESLADYRHYPKEVVWSLFITVLIFLGMVLSTDTVFLTFGKELSLVSLFIYLPIIYILTLIPFSFNGAAIREYAFLLFFADKGIDQNDIVLYALVFYLSVTLVSLLGGFMYFYDNTLNTFKRGKQ